MKCKGTSKSPRKSVSGITLVDVVVSVFVLATIGSAFCAALSSGFSILQATREDLRATQILMQKVEAIRLCTWSELTNFTFQETYDPMAATNQAGTKYFGNVSITPASSIPNTASYAPNMCLVTVNLNWTNSIRWSALSHTRQMQTQVARYGLQSYIWGAMK